MELGTDTWGVTLLCQAHSWALGTVTGLMLWDADAQSTASKENT